MNIINHMKKLKIITAYCLLFFLAAACNHVAQGDQESPISEQKSTKIKNVILMIGDGMGPSQVYAGLTANNGSLHLEKSSYSGFIKTNSSDDYVTDSAAGATAYATGHKTYNGAIGVDS